MAFNRKQWSDWYTNKPCPHCNSGVLVGDIKKGYFKHETPESKDLSEHNYPYTNYYFSLSLVCTKCNEIVIVTGTFEETNSPIDDKGTIGKSVSPKFFIPTLLIIDIPKKCPILVKNELINSFSVFWNEPPSAANKIRVSVELLMDSLKINKTIITSRGKRRYLKLHERLIIYKSKNNEIADLLMSIKWIGNAGSHSAKVTKENLLDAYQLLQYALDLLYSTNKKELTALSKKINNKKGV